MPPSPDHFDVFDPWTEPTRWETASPPWEPPLPGSDLEPAVVGSTKDSTGRRRRVRQRFVASPPLEPPPDPATHPTEFLMHVVVPEIQFMGRRLEAARHYTTVQDLLELATPTLRVLIWPRPGLLDHAAGRALATMEILLEGEPGQLTTSYWWGSRPQDVVVMAQIPSPELTLEWARAQVLDFIQKMLDQA